MEKAKNHVELHDKMWTMLEKMEKNQVKPQFAKEYFNGCGKIINKCQTELQAVSMGGAIDIPLLGISADEAGRYMANVKAKKKITKLIED